VIPRMRPVRTVVALGLLLGLAAPARAQSSDLAELEHRVAAAPDDYDATLALGVGYLERERWTDAFITFHKAAALRRYAADPWFHLGLLYFERGLPDREIEAYRQALAREPGHVQAALNLGHALVSRSDPDGAVAAYGMVLEREPDHPVALYNIGIIFADLGDVEPAAAYLERYLESAPPDDPWRATAERVLDEVSR